MTTRRTGTWRSSSTTSACRASNLLLGEGRGLRDRAGAARAGAHPPLHADDRRRRGSAGAMVQAAAEPRRLRQEADRSIASGSSESPRRGSTSTCTRLLCLKAADMMDKAGQQGRPGRDRDDQGEGAAVWRCSIIDDAVQAHRCGGRQPGLRRSPQAGPGIRTLRLADGPDEVHNRAIAKMEFAKHVPA